MPWLKLAQDISHNLRSLEVVGGLAAGTIKKVVTVAPNDTAAEAVEGVDFNFVSVGTDDASEALGHVSGCRLGKS